MNQLGGIFHVEDNGDDADPLLVPFKSHNPKSVLHLRWGLSCLAFSGQDPRWVLDQRNDVRLHE